MPRRSLRFLRRGEVFELADVEPDETLLDYLRLREGATGTKEGCAEGDCGACTVVLGRLRGDRLHYEPVNACIHLLGMVDGRELVTVEDLSPPGEALHPVQQAMVEHHGSQCGFCTPGFVMSLFALYHRGTAADRANVNDWLAGNLCRCTGYRPIADAALASCTGPPDDAFSLRAPRTAAALSALDGDEDLFIGGDEAFFAAPRSTASLADLYLRYPNATLVAGATDVALWITKQLRRLPRIIHLGRVRELLRIDRDGGSLVLGATVSYADAEEALGGVHPDIAEVLRRLGSKQIRAAGSVGGNIANGSPIGDAPPPLIALGSEVELRRGDEVRRLALEDFFIDYGRQDRRPGEFVSRLMVPRLAPGQHFSCYKISKRFDQDISALLGAFRFSVSAGRVVEARVAYGGMAATPKRAVQCEAALNGVSLDSPGDWQRAQQALDRDFSPIDDMRASATYRAKVAKALLSKALLEARGTPRSETRVVGAESIRTRE